jgi:stearoyl-CoA desaturase (delta-9 desaturase)
MAGLVFFYAMFVAGAYHRYFSHRTFDCHPVLKGLMLVFSSGALQNSALKWAAQHRLHHRYVDTPRDPYNIKRGFWWAHWGWLFAPDAQGEADWRQIAPDLSQDAMINWQHRYWLPMGLVLSLGIPLAIGFAIGRPIGMLLWAGFLRMVISHHTTFSINSIAHWFGKQPYSDRDSSRDVWWLAPFLCGESYHNYHHTFQSDYRNGVKWYHWDPVKWTVWLLNHTPWVHRLRRAPQHRIWQARLEMEIKGLERHWQRGPKESWVNIQVQLSNWRNTFDEAAARWIQAKKRYQEFKKDLQAGGQESLRQAKQAYREQHEKLEALVKEWRRFLLQAYQHPALQTT